MTFRSDLTVNKTLMTTVNGKKIKTVCGNVLVKLSKLEEKTSSGIIIPNTKKETDFKGEVMAVSELDDLNKVGDIVIVRKHAGIKVNTDDNEQYRLYGKDDILWNLTQNPVK